LHYGVTGSTSTAAETEAGMLLAVTSLDPEKPPSETIASATFCNGVPDAGTVIAGAGRLPGAAIWPVAAIGADADAGAFLGGTATDMSGDGVFSGNGKGGLGTGFAALPNVAMETVEAAAMAAVNGVAVKGATESCGLSVWATAVGALGTTCAAMSDSGCASFNTKGACGCARGSEDGTIPRVRDGSNATPGDWLPGHDCVNGCGAVERTDVGWLTGTVLCAAEAAGGAWGGCTREAAAATVRGGCGGVVARTVAAAAATADAEAADAITGAAARGLGIVNGPSVHGSASCCLAAVW